MCAVFGNIILFILPKHDIRSAVISSLIENSYCHRHEGPPRVMVFLRHPCINHKQRTRQ